MSGRSSRTEKRVRREAKIALFGSHILTLSASATEIGSMPSWGGRLEASLSGWGVDGRPNPLIFEGLDFLMPYLDLFRWLLLLEKYKQRKNVRYSKHAGCCNGDKGRILTNIGLNSPCQNLNSTVGFRVKRLKLMVDICAAKQDSFGVKYVSIVGNKIHRWRHPKPKKYEHQTEMG